MTAAEIRESSSQEVPLMMKVLRIKLSVRVFEQLQAEAAAENLRGVELARRFIGDRYRHGVLRSAPTPPAIDARAGADTNANQDKKSRPSSPETRGLLQDGNLAFRRATDAYGRIASAVERVAEGPQRAEIGRDLEIVGDAVAILPELIEMLEGAQFRSEPRGGRKAVAANDNDDDFST